MVTDGIRNRPLASVTTHSSSVGMETTQPAIGSFVFYSVTVPSMETFFGAWACTPSGMQTPANKSISKNFFTANRVM